MPSQSGLVPSRWCCETARVVCTRGVPAGAAADIGEGRAPRGGRPGSPCGLRRAEAVSFADFNQDLPLRGPVGRRLVEPEDLSRHLEKPFDPRVTCPELPPWPTHHHRQAHVELPAGVGEQPSARPILLGFPQSAAKSPLFHADRDSSRNALLSILAPLALIRVGSDVQGQVNPAVLQTGAPWGSTVLMNLIC